MGKPIILIVGVALVGACAGRHHQPTQAAHSQGVVQAVYACEAGPIVIVRDREQINLVDATVGNVIPASWSSADGDHFLSFERVGPDRRPVAFEYFVPADRRRSVTLRTYDRASGAHFKVTAKPKTWRISGEPSASSQCSAADGQYALRYGP